MNFRKIGFSFVDFLMGRPITDNVNELEKFYNASSQNNRLQIDALFEHAIKTTRYYSQFQGSTFDRLPILEKEKIQEVSEQFISNNYRKNELYVMRTSGSTGKPLTVYQDKNKKSKVRSEIIFFNKKFGHDLGLPYLYVKSFPQKRKIYAWLKNEKQIDITTMKDSDFDEVLLNIKKGNISSILAYAAFYRELIHFLENNNISKMEGGLNQIITSSSYLDLSMKEKLQTYFETVILDRYSNQENGLLAHAVGVSDVFSVNYANYFIEIVDPITHNHVKPGETGLIVVTDLYNFGMPLLRYNTGDLARLKEYNKHVGVVSFDQLQGRVVNTLRLSNGSLVSTHSISVFFREYKEVKEFKVNVFNISRIVEIELILKKHVHLDNIQKDIEVFFNEEYEIQINIVKDIKYKSNSKKEVLEVIES